MIKISHTTYLKTFYLFISLSKTKKQKTRIECNQALKHHSNGKWSKKDQLSKTNQCTRTTHTIKDNKEKGKKM